MEHAQNRTIEDVINTVDTNYRLSPYLKLRGHISFKAAKLAGMCLAKTAKAYMNENNLVGIDAFNEAMAIIHGEDISNEGLIEMGLPVGDNMYETLIALVEYSNKLNMDMLELVDPSGTKCLDPHWKQIGVYSSESQRIEAWTSTVNNVAELDNKPEMTYAEYKKTITNTDWLLTEDEFNEANKNDDTLFKDHRPQIVDLILAIGDNEIDSLDLPLRIQISAIENMRGKIPACIQSALKSVKFSRVKNKILEASTVKGIINSWDKLYCEMLDLPRFIPLREFMYGYAPSTEGTEHKPIARRIQLKEEKAIITKIIDRKMTDAELRAHESKLKVEHDMATMESDEL